MRVRAYAVVGDGLSRSHAGDGRGGGKISPGPIGDPRGLGDARRAKRVEFWGQCADAPESKSTITTARPGETVRDAMTCVREIHMDQMIGGEYSPPTCKTQVRS
jgi:hypothetical protein